MATGRCPYGEEWGRGGVAQTGGRALCPALRAGKIRGVLVLCGTSEGVTMRRPGGISVLGGLVLLAAVILILISIASFIVGLAFLLPFPNGGPKLPGTELLLNAVLYFVIGGRPRDCGIGAPADARVGVRARGSRHARHARL